MLTNVQALRALAALLVVFVHLKALAVLLGLGPGAVDFGNSGVDVFFVISGMIMVLTTSRRPTTAATFLKNRIARIVPFYWLITAVVFSLALAAPSLFGGTRADPLELVKSLSFVPYARQDHVVAPIVFVGWTLNYEMAFYALFALGLALPRRWMGMTLALTVMAIAAGIGFWLRPNDALGWFYSSPIILEFGLGMIIGAVVPHLGRIGAPRPLVAGLGIAAFAAMLAGPQLGPGLDRFFIYGLPAAVVVVSVVYLERAGWVLRQPLLVLLGDASFATYLTHFFVTQAAVKAVGVLGLSSPVLILLTGGATFLAVAATGVVVHLFVERPLSLGVKRLLTGEARARAARPASGAAASTGDMAV